MEVKSDKPKNHTIVHVFVMVLSAVLGGAVFIRATVFAAKNYYINTHANFVQEYATIVRYEAFHNRYNSGYTYTTFYEYEADGGVYYGMWQRLIKDEEVAKAQVGKKVRIYVDHALKRHTTTLEFSTVPVWIAGTFSVACIFLFINSFVRETIYIVRQKRYKNANKPEKITNNTKRA